MKAFLVGLTLLLCSCVSGSSSVSRAPHEVSAKAVVLQAGDVPDMQKCIDSDRWAGLMLVGQPEMLPTGFATWSDLQAAGAAEGWLSMYADHLSECPLLFGSATPKGRLVYTVAIKFKNASSAAASFASGSQGFPVAADFSARFAAAGGEVAKGANTGIGQNSAVATITARGVPTYVAYWQNKNFEAVVWADNFSAAQAESAVARVNGRIS